MMKLVLLRHGESEWNKLNLFTGWTDVELSDKGREEAKQAGITMKNEGYDFDVCYTSYLKRAIHTLNIALDEMDRAWLPVVKSWKLNERHYGALQGLNKAETAEKYGEEQVKNLEQMALLRNVDMRWMDHIDAMAQLQNNIGLRAYAQKDPVVAFRQESFDMFDEMSMNIREGTVQFVLTAVIRTEADIRREQQARITSTTSSSAGTGDGTDKKRPVKKGVKVGRNDPCPCGSGLKYKKCCGRNVQD